MSEQKVIELLKDYCKWCIAQGGQCQLELGGCSVGDALAELSKPACETCICMDCGKVIKVTEQSNHLKECPKEKLICETSKIKVFKCKHFRGYSQSVPAPFSSGNCSEELGDCAIESESENCTFECPDYEESPTPAVCELCGGSGTIVNPTFGPDDPSQPPYLGCSACKPPSGQPEAGEFTKKMRELHKQAVGTHWVNDSIVQELANAVPKLCDSIDRLEAENKRLNKSLTIAIDYVMRGNRCGRTREGKLKDIETGHY